MPANDPTDDLNYAVRQVLITNATLSDAGVFFGRPPRTDSGSFVRLGIQNEKPMDVLAGVAYWEIDMAVLAGAEESLGVSAEATAYALRKLCYDLLDGGTAALRKTAKAALNALLSARGWSLMLPLAAMGIPIYPDYIDDVARVQTGHLYRFRIQPL